MAPLRENRAFFSEFNSLLALDPNKYIQGLDQPDQTIDSLRSEIIKHMDKAKTISEKYVYPKHLNNLENFEDL